LQEILWSFGVPSPPPPNYRLLLAITMIKPSFYWLPQRSDQLPIFGSLPLGPKAVFTVAKSGITDLGLYQRRPFCPEAVFTKRK
jgi:hypothetical protein